MARCRMAGSADPGAMRRWIDRHRPVSGTPVFSVAATTAARSAGVQVRRASRSGVSSMEMSTKEKPARAAWVRRSSKEPFHFRAFS